VLFACRGPHLSVLASRITLLHRRRCRNGQRRRLTNLRPTTSGSAGSSPVPLEAGVVVLVPVLVGRTRMQLCHGARPLSSLHPGLRGVVGITEPTYTSIGTRVLPRAQGRKKCPVRSPSRYVGMPTGAYMRHNPRRAPGPTGGAGLAAFVMQSRRPLNRSYAKLHLPA